MSDILDLEQIQRTMFSIISNPLTDNFECRNKLEDGEASRNIADKIMLPNDRLSGLERIEIYNKQYWFRLIDCLYDDFPGLRAILGRKKFNTLVFEYLKKYPSSSYSLRDLGSNLPKFISENPTLTGKRYTAAQDMVNFEWAQIVAFDGPSLKVFDPQSCPAEELPNVQLQLQPYLSVLELSYPFDNFIIALKKSGSVRSTEASANEDIEAIDFSPSVEPAKLPKKKKTLLVVHRFNNALYYKRLSEDAFNLLNVLIEGATLTEACESALVISTDPAAMLPRVQGWFSNWSSLGWFSRK